MLVLLFWLFAIASIYSYFIYPIILQVLSRQRRHVSTAFQQDSTRTYSLIVTVYNEKHRIEEKLQNLLSLDFDRERLEIIIASDSSDDGTDEIVQTYQDQGIMLVRATERLGKENAQLAAIKSAKGDVLVFSDVATIMEPDALSKLEKHFDDPEVGAVSSEDRFISQDGSVAGEGAYVKYEMWLRKQESRLGGLVGLSGSFFATRKEICRDWDIYSPSDFNTALNCAKAGFRSVSAPDVLGFYQDLKDPSKEYARKVRTVLRGMTGLARHPEVLNVSRLGLFSFQVFSHKLMRWGVPWFLALLLLVTWLLLGQGWVYSLAFVLQVAFYGTAIAAHFHSGVRSNPIAKLIYFFVQVNIALMDSAIKFFTGKKMTTWKPSAR
ncbi:glycosyltransferase family 2 protein [Reinekea blandensis]|uniref:Glycosyltransferase, probably involved in cell wall biogenesis n=1 Tax=Reinekea blandensis MED297 TaxID=314283 RepID=A4B936_9GAMM|nr:glycosyltransferase family 2 protein [Reinekea blandensis]EAR11137.1 Glycosyltransferase, probably involved in cell wall biogenesis [Reinekea sp. MED297] [Reinekea blandensis MED297]